MTFQPARFIRPACCQATPCALTARFHPYPERRYFSVTLSVHWLSPLSHPLGGAALYVVRTFLPSRQKRLRRWSSPWCGAKLRILGGQGLMKEYNGFRRLIDATLQPISSIKSTLFNYQRFQKFLEGDKGTAKCFILYAVVPANCQGRKLPGWLMSVGLVEERAARFGR